MTFSSCEKDDINFDSDSVELESEIEAKFYPRLVNVNRYYAGPPYTIYSYRMGTAGSNFGSYQGVKFKLGLVPRDRFNPYIHSYKEYPSGTIPVYLVKNKGNYDFLITTNANERNNLVNSGHWQDVSKSYTRIPSASPYPDYFFELPYIHTSGGGGRVKLHRFYDNKGQSIHLFTTNYNEGASKGYLHEGAIGWVHP